MIRCMIDTQHVMIRVPSWGTVPYGRDSSLPGRRVQFMVATHPMVTCGASDFDGVLRSHGLSAIIGDRCSKDVGAKLTIFDLALTMH